MIWPKRLQLAGRDGEAKKAFAEFETKSLAESGRKDNSNRELVFYYADHAHQPAKALEVAEQEYAWRHDVYTLDAYAWALHVNGQDAEARKQIETALAVGIRDSKIFAHAGEIALKLGDRAAAQNYLQEAVSLHAIGIGTCAACPGPDSQRRAPHVRTGDHALTLEKPCNSCCVADWALSSSPASQEIALRGQVTDPQGNALAKASVQLLPHDSGGKGQALRQTTAGPDGRFEIKAASAGQFDIRVDAEGFRQLILTQSIHPSGNPEITIRMGQISSRVETVTVTADVNETDVLSPDPGEKVFVRRGLAGRESRPPRRSGVDSRISD